MYGYQLRVRFHKELPPPSPRPPKPINTWALSDIGFPYAVHLCNLATMSTKGSNHRSRRASTLRKKLLRLREERRQRKGTNKAPRRSLTQRQRTSVLKKTGRRCHVCGGRVGRKWHADHIASHALGGEHAEDNYLPAHELCNNYRWHYLPEEFQLIMKLGVWARTQVEKGTPIGIEIAERFAVHEERRKRRTVR